jgi:hypothetical protein
MKLSHPAHTYWRRLNNYLKSQVKDLEKKKYREERVKIFRGRGGMANTYEDYVKGK